MGASTVVRAPGEFIEAGGNRLHVLTCGDGFPPVLLEAGVAASSVSWACVQPQLARTTRAIAYDRAGLAWSDAPVSPITFDRILRDVHAVVLARSAGQPIILVGHSFGSLIVRGYAAAHPDEVAGLVLVDPPMEWISPTAEHAWKMRRARQASGIGAFLARIGVVRAALSLLTGGRPGVPRTFVKVFGSTAASTLERLVAEVRKLPPELYPVVQEHWSQPKCFRAMAGYLGVLEKEAATIAAAVPPSHIPVVVISGNHQPPAELEAHQHLAEASPRGRHVVARQSGHWILFDEPELIVEAVQRLMRDLA